MFSLTREELELLTDIPNFTTLFYVTLRRESSKWLESFIESNLGMQLLICNMEPPLSLLRSYFLQTLFLMQEQIIKKGTLLAYFLDSGK